MKFILQGTVLPISKAVCNVTARIGERVYRSAGCCVHIHIKRTKGLCMDVSLCYLWCKQPLNTPIKWKNMSRTYQKCPNLGIRCCAIVTGYPVFDIEWKYTKTRFLHSRVSTTRQTLHYWFAILPWDNDTHCFLKYDINYELWICKGDSNSSHVCKKILFSTIFSIPLKRGNPWQ